MKSAPLSSSYNCTIPSGYTRSIMVDINALIKTVPQLLDPSISIKLVEVAKKYNTPEVGLGSDTMNDPQLM